MDDQLGREEFTTFGPSHLGALAVFVIGVFVIIAIGRSHRGTPAAHRFCKVFAILIPVFTVPLQVLQLTPAEWNLDTSLPLQLCDFGWVFAVYALWTRKPWAVTLTYLWGITLTSQAMITPDLVTNFPEPRFLMFWAMHMLIVWASFYLTWGLGLTPTWRAYGSTVAITVVWTIGAFIFNLAAGTNYGYLNRKPGRASALDLLGSWPTYVFLEIAIVLAVWALMTWPWVRARRTAVSV